MARKIIFGAVATLAFAPLGAFAAQFHAPLHLPPHRLESATASGPTAWFGAGYGGLRGPGMSLSGPGGFMELAGSFNEESYGSFRTGGFLLSGEMDPFDRGRRRTNGFAGDVEGSVAWAPWGRESLHAYAGLLTNITVLDVRDPLVIQFTAPADPRPTAPRAASTSTRPPGRVCA